MAVRSHTDFESSIDLNPYEVQITEAMARLNVLRSSAAMLVGRNGTSEMKARARANQDGTWRVRMMLSRALGGHTDDEFRSPLWAHRLTPLETIKTLLWYEKEIHAYEDATDPGFGKIWDTRREAHFVDLLSTLGILREATGPARQALLAREAVEKIQLPEDYNEILKDKYEGFTTRLPANNKWLQIISEAFSGFRG